MTSAPTPVFFVYRRSLAKLGSTQLRCFQLCEIMRRHGSGTFEYHTLPIPNLRLDGMRDAWAQMRPKGAVFIFVKDAIDRLHPAALARLQARAAAVLHDPIDRRVSATPRAHVDVHIASSVAQRIAVQAHLVATAAPAARVELLLHQADIRLQENPPLPMDRLHPTYFGDPANAYLPDPIARRIPVVNVALARNMEDSLNAFTTANFHYAVRPTDQAASTDIIKPLTKAVIAARCGAPIMVNRSAHDAETLLGYDYPYLVEHADPDSVATILDRAQSGFGGSEWKAAQDRLRALETRVGPVQTAQNLEHILEKSL